MSGVEACTQVICMLNVFLELDYAASKLQRLFDRRNQGQKSQIARKWK